MDLSACLNTLSIDAAIYASGASTIGLIVLFSWLIMHEDFPGRRYFVTTIGAMVVWLLFGAAELATPDLSCKIATASATWPAIALAPIAWCLFMWSFCFDPIRRSARTVVIWVGSLVIAISALAISNPLHGLFYGPETEMIIESGRLSADFDHGPLFYVAAGVLYAFLLSALAIATIAAFRASRPVRPLMMALTFATAVPMAANLGYILLDATIFGFDPTPFAFAFILFALTPMLYSPRGFDIAAMARDLLYYNLPNPVIVVNDRGVITGVNPASTERLPRIAPGRSLDACAPSAIVEQFADYRSKGAIQGEVEFSDRAFLIDVLPIPGRSHSGGEPVGAIGILTDVTPLKLQEERSRIIVNTVSDILWDYDFDSDTWWMSSDWPLKIGITLSVPQIGAEEWFKKVHPDDREKLDRSFLAILKSNDENWEIDYRLVGDDGESIDVLVKAAVIRHPNGRIARMLGNVRNISAEKRQAEGYTRAKALETLGQMTGGIAHDFNNQLMIIQGNVELLEMSQLDKDQAASVALIEKASQSSVDLTRRLLSFSRQSQLRTEKVDISETLPRIVTLLRAGIPESISITYAVEDGIWSAKADANALEQAIVNLALNARDAMPGGGNLVISCKNQTFLKGVQSGAFDAESGDYVMISVSDNGEGMAPDVLAKAFEPFFTTKGVGAGTGLGLSTVFGFARQSGGHVTISSEINEGTTVNLILPRFEEAKSEEKAEPSIDHSNIANGERILLVEDHPDVRTHVEKILTMLGYSVSAVSDGKEALSLMYRALEFDLLFTDVYAVM